MADPLDVGGAVLGGAMLAGSWAVIGNDARVPDWEARFFAPVHALHDGAWPVVWLPMQLGSYVGSIVVVGAATLATGDRRLGLSALAASQAAFWAAKVVKRRVARGRPSALLPDVRAREDAIGLGYISGHAAVAFSLAATLAPGLPLVWRPVVVAVAAGIGVARVYAGVHLPLDVVGGIGLGLMAAATSRWVFRHPIA